MGGGGGGGGGGASRAFFLALSIRLTQKPFQRHALGRLLTDAFDELM